jgi:hypothetical protein
MITSIAEFSHSNHEKILGRKHIYLPHVQTAIYDSKGKVIFKTGNIPSTWSWLNAIVRFECENSAIDVVINEYMTTQHFVRFFLSI